MYLIICVCLSSLAECKLCGVRESIWFGSLLLSTVSRTVFITLQVPNKDLWKEWMNEWMNLLVRLLSLVLPFILQVNINSLTLSTSPFTVNGRWTIWRFSVVVMSIDPGTMPPGFKPGFTASSKQHCPIELFAMIEIFCSTQSSSVVTSHVDLLSTWSVASVTEELNF